MDFMANCLLSLGAAPIMTQEIRELDELVQISQTLNINIGTLDASFMDRAHTAVQLAQTFNKPIILDPVGAGASAIRTESARALMPFAHIVRGNASEIMAITDSAHQTLGVESRHQVSDAIGCATSLAKYYNATVVISGVQDLVTDGEREQLLGFGSSLMPHVTGMGCALTAVIAAFRAVIADTYEAARLATAFYTLCGSLAAGKTNKPGTFRTLFIDELYAADFVAMRTITHAL